MFQINESFLLVKESWNFIMVSTKLLNSTIVFSINKKCFLSTKSAY